MKKVHVNSIVLTELPSEVLVHILQYCNGNQILNFSEACGVGQTKIEDVVRNRRLWQKVHIGPGNLRRYMKFLGSYTSDIILEGTLRVGKDTRPLKSSSLDKSEHVPESLLSSIRLRCPSLASLTFLRCCLDVEKVRVSLLPRTLKHLTFSSVHFVNLPP